MNKIKSKMWNIFILSQKPKYKMVKNNNEPTSGRQPHPKF